MVQFNLWKLVSAQSSRLIKANNFTDLWPHYKYITKSWLHDTEIFLYMYVRGKFLEQPLKTIKEYRIWVINTLVYHTFNACFLFKSYVFFMALTWKLLTVMTMFYDKYRFYLQRMFSHTRTNFDRNILHISKILWRLVWIS